METRKLITICLLFLGITGTTLADDPNGGNPDYSELGEIASHWVEDYSPAICCLPIIDYNCTKTLYIDGVYVDEATVDQWLTWPIDRITIGTEGSRWFMYNEYVGKLDDFAIYQGALSAAQVTEHWDARGNYATYQAAVTADNPLLWLKLDETDTNDGMVANNSAGIIDGTYVAMGPGVVIKPTAGFVAGSNGVELNVNGRGVLGGPNGVCIDVWDGDGVFGENLDGDVTIELWANCTDLNDYPRFFQHNGAWDVLDSYGLVAQLNDGNTLAVMGGGMANFMHFENDINDGQWHHIVVTYDSYYSVVMPDLNNFYVEVVAADNPVLWLCFEDDIPQDSSGNDYWVGYGDGTSIVERVGGIGKSLYMDGSSSSYAAATNSHNPPPNQGDPNSYEVFGDQYAFAPDDITFELWYRVPYGQDPAPDTYAYFFQQAGGWDWPPQSGEFSYHAPAVGSIGDVDPTIGIMHGTGQWLTDLSSGFDGNWHHLVVTYDEQYQGDPCSMHAQLYVDGYLRAENTFTDTNGLAKLGPELSHIMVGAQNNIGYTYNAFAGYVDEFAIYQGILDPYRIATHYEAWQPKTCEELWDRQLIPPWAEIADKDHNCYVDFYDFADFALQWAIGSDE